MGPVSQSQYFLTKCDQHDLICGICLDPYKEPQINPECLHVFCKQCIEGITDCPCCRKPVYPENLKYDYDKANRINAIWEKAQERQEKKVLEECICCNVIDSTPPVDKTVFLEQLREILDPELFSTEQEELILKVIASFIETTHTDRTSEFCRSHQQLLVHEHHFVPFEIVTIINALKTKTAISFFEHGENPSSRLYLINFLTNLFKNEHNRITKEFTEVFLPNYTYNEDVISFLDILLLELCSPKRRLQEHYTCDLSLQELYDIADLLEREDFDRWVFDQLRYIGVESVRKIFLTITNRKFLLSYRSILNKILVNNTLDKNVTTFLEVLLKEFEKNSDEFNKINYKNIVAKAVNESQFDTNIIKDTYGIFINPSIRNRFHGNNSELIIINVFSDYLKTIDNGYQLSDKTIADIKTKWENEFESESLCRYLKMFLNNLFLPRTEIKAEDFENIKIKFRCKFPHKAAAIMCAYLLDDSFVNQFMQQCPDLTKSDIRVALSNVFPNFEDLYNAGMTLI